MQQVIRRRVVVESKGRISVHASGLREGTTAEVLVIVDAETPRAQNKTLSQLHEAIAAYAAEHAGTESDLDSALEDATVELLTSQAKGKRR